MDYETAGHITATHDTSHYTKCRELMHKHRKNHMLRFWLTVAICVMNGYIYLVPMPMTRTTDDYPIFVRNGIWDIGFLFAVIGFILMIAIMALSFFATQDRPKLICLTQAVLVLAVVIDVMLLWLAIPCMLLCFWSHSEVGKEKWLREQSGYPYFNERFTEQMTSYGHKYKSRYDLRHKMDQLIEELDSEKEQDAFSVSLDHKTAASLEQHYSIPAADAEAPAAPSPMMKQQPSVVSAISEISEKPKAKKKPVTEPLPEPEMPNGNAIPDPVWDVPDPVMDTGAVLSDFPEINGDIPDLPDIPDIPKL